MCTLCDRGKPQLHSTSRRNFLKGTAATGLAAGAMGLFGSSAEAQGHNVNPPPHTGRPGRRYVIRNGYVMTMEPGTPGAELVIRRIHRRRRARRRQDDKGHR